MFPFSLHPNLTLSGKEDSEGSATLASYSVLLLSFSCFSTQTAMGSSPLPSKFWLQLKCLAYFPFDVVSNFLPDRKVFVVCLIIIILQFVLHYGREGVILNKAATQILFR